MAKKRVTRKQLLKEPDEFITFTGRMIQWGRDNTRSLVYGACAVVAVLVLIAAMGYYKDRQERASAALMGRILSAYQQGQADDTDPALLLSMVRPDLEQLVDQYRRYPAGRQAKLLLGHLYLNAGDADNAITYYRKALADFGKDPSLRPVILNGLAEAYALKGDRAGAITQYEQIAAGGKRLLVDTALFHLGRLYREGGQIEKSRQALERLSTDFPDSMYADMAREQTAG
ncbi:tetratricopeptide repeat protein [Desulfatitalea alkaliphila]|uniref:Tetratricopeptide repeat protein n=1 Tax=Desulfatitalea alkaliphila TaxID=2929485 RepID=A0AA41R572_9BACT|nr:tetratricopeptide repeat protein [Desulfatitalea alkaliphila]MCJ8502072.1 tetratricopeptide repeat protein [Desulfatitalea alkaliphila]